MSLERKRKGTAREKRNNWSRGNGIYSYRGELKRGISENKRYLNRKIRYKSDIILQNESYRRVYRTASMIKFI